MSGEIALDSNIAIRFLNGNPTVVEKIVTHSTLILPIPVVGELLFGAENSSRPLENLSRFQHFIEVCSVIPINRNTARIYARTRLELKKMGPPIPENDIWIAAQCLEHRWTLVTDDKHFSFVSNLVTDNW